MLLHKKTSGFTLMEVVLVITLLLLLGGTLLTTMGVSGTELDVAAKRVREDIEYAQDMAMVQGVPFGFYAPNLTSYEIFENSPGLPATDPLTHESMSVNLTGTYHIVYFALAPPQIMFNPDGAPTLVGSSSIILTDGKHNKILTMNTMTGALSGP